MERVPQPRVSNYFGMRSISHVNPDGTWLEPEELCYPRGGTTRKAYVLCPDGIKRISACGIPDTWFSIPARLRVKGQTITGYVTGKENEDFSPSYEFRVHTAEQPKFSELTGHRFAIAE